MTEEKVPFKEAFEAFQSVPLEEREKRIEELEKENAELKEKLALRKYADTYYDELTKATEIIKKLYKDCYSIADVEDLNLGLWEEDLNQAQQFIKEIERC